MRYLIFAKMTGIVSFAAGRAQYWSCGINRFNKVGDHISARFKNGPPRFYRIFVNL
jgi:hypothetical protein